MILSFLRILFFIATLAEITIYSHVLLLVIWFVFLWVFMLQPRYHDSLIFSLIVLLAIVCSAFFATLSLFIFFVSFEFSLFPVSLIILLFGYQPEKISATLYILLYTVTSSAPLFLFVVTHICGSINEFRLATDLVVTAISLCFFVKSPIYCVHIWLPKAHVEAPLFGSMLLAGVILKIGGYGLMLLCPFFSPFILVYLWFTLLGSVVCVLLCVRAWDTKTLVAYSSIIHIGVVSLGVLSGSSTGLSLALGISVAHSLCSPLLFFLAFEIYVLSGRRSFIVGFNSSACTGLSFFLGIFIGVSFGLPPTLGFWVEVCLFCTMHSFFSCSVLVLSVSSFFRFVFSVLFYILSLGGSPSSNAGCKSCYYALLPGLFLSFATRLVRF